MGRGQGRIGFEQALQDAEYGGLSEHKGVSDSNSPSNGNVGAMYNGVTYTFVRGANCWSGLV